MPQLNHTTVAAAQEQDTLGTWFAVGAANITLLMLCVVVALQVLNKDVQELPVVAADADQAAVHEPEPPPAYTAVAHV